MITEGSNRGKRRKRVEILYIKNLRNNATVPCRDTSVAAGYDLSSAKDVVIPGKSKRVVKTRLEIAVPKGTYTIIAPRSRLGVKQLIDVGAGVVDADCRSKVGAALFNHANDDFHVYQGDCIFQLFLKRSNTCNRGCR